MASFDLRITGEIGTAESDILREQVASLLASIVGLDGTIGCAMLNGREMKVSVGRVEVNVANPDRWIAELEASASSRVEQPFARVALRGSDRHEGRLASDQPGDVQETDDGFAPNWNDVPPTDEPVQVGSTQTLEPNAPPVVATLDEPGDK